MCDRSLVSGTLNLEEFMVSVFDYNDCVKDFNTNPKHPNSKKRIWSIMSDIDQKKLLRNAVDFVADRISQDQSLLQIIAKSVSRCLAKRLITNANYNNNNNNNNNIHNNNNNNTNTNHTIIIIRILRIIRIIILILILNK